jgi:hypothetical protein
VLWLWDRGAGVANDDAFKRNIFNVATVSLQAIVNVNKTYVQISGTVECKRYVLKGVRKARRGAGFEAG